jgi:DNA polymerase delta subunit 2
MKRRCEERVLNRRFVLGKRDYQHQFAPLYNVRLQALEPPLQPVAQTKWPGVKCVKILSLEEGKPCFVIGTLVKEMPLKPNVLEEYAHEVRLNFISFLHFL